MNVPPFVISIVSNLPPSAQEKLQVLIMKAIEDPYLVSLATIPTAFYLAYLPHFLKVGIMFANKGVDYNNESPRSEDLGGYKVLPGIMVRAKAAHNNCLEMFPFFAAAVLLAKIQNADPQPLTSLAAKYIGLRVLYIFCYVFGVNRFVALVRSGVWVQCLSTVGKIAFLGL